MKPNKKAELAHWIRRQLGAPLVDVMVESSQMEDCIDLACDHFSEFAGGVGHEESVVLIRTRTAEEKEEFRNSATVVTSSSPASGAEMLWMGEYQLPRDVFALTETLRADPRAYEGSREPIERSLTYASEYGMAGGLAGTNSIGGTYGFFYPGAASYSSYYGSAGGQGTRSTGGGIDLVSYELGLQYLEMMQQRYTIKTYAQFLEQSRKVRFTPVPKENGIIALSCWVRVCDEHLYENLWVKRYAKALAMKQIAFNVKKYTGASFPGGANIDGDFYLSEAKEEIEKLEQQLKDNDFGFPPGFFIG